MPVEDVAEPDRPDAEDDEVRASGLYAQAGTFLQSSLDLLKACQEGGSVDRADCRLVPEAIQSQAYGLAKQVELTPSPSAEQIAAVSRKSDEAMAALLDKGADPNKPFQGQIHNMTLCCDPEVNSSPFYRAAIAADVDVLKVLLAHGGRALAYLATLPCDVLRLSAVVYAQTKDSTSSEERPVHGVWIDLAAGFIEVEIVHLVKSDGPLRARQMEKVQNDLGLPGGFHDPR